MNIQNILLTTKDKILSASVKLFSEKGYDATSVRDIAQEVGIKSSSLYNHYKSKEDILQEIFVLFKNDIEQIKFDEDKLLNQVYSIGIEEFFIRGAVNYIHIADDFRKSRIWSIISMEQYRNKKAADLILNETERFLKITEKIFSVLIANNLIKDRNVKVLSYEYCYGLRSIHLEYLLVKSQGEDTEYLIQRVKQRTRLFCQILKKSE